MGFHAQPCALGGVIAPNRAPATAPETSAERGGAGGKSEWHGSTRECLGEAPARGALRGVGVGERKPAAAQHQPGQLKSVPCAGVRWGGVEVFERKGSEMHPEVFSPPSRG